MRLFSSPTVTCLARSTACRTCCWCWRWGWGQGHSGEHPYLIRDPTSQTTPSGTPPFIYQSHPAGIWDLSSLTRNATRTPYSGSTGPSGKHPPLFFSHVLYFLSLLSKSGNKQSNAVQFKPILRKQSLYTRVPAFGAADVVAGSPCMGTVPGTVVRGAPSLPPTLTGCQKHPQ